jgi:Ca2+-binding RTX toxin-like protein
VPAFLFAGTGNTVLDARGSIANNVLVGGGGQNTLWDGTGSNILIGGAGQSTLHGNLGSDIVIGDSTIYDSNITALNAILTEWARTDVSMAVKKANLDGTATGGTLDGYAGPLLTTSTIIDNGLTDIFDLGTGMHPNSDWKIDLHNGINP